MIIKVRAFKAGLELRTFVLPTTPYVIIMEFTPELLGQKRFTDCLHELSYNISLLPYFLPSFSGQCTQQNIIISSVEPRSTFLAVWRSYRSIIIQSLCTTTIAINRFLEVSILIERSLTPPPSCAEFRRSACSSRL